MACAPVVARNIVTAWAAFTGPTPVRTIPTAGCEPSSRSRRSAPSSSVATQIRRSTAMPVSQHTSTPDARGSSARRRSARPGPVEGCRSTGSRRCDRAERQEDPSIPCREVIVLFFIFLPHHDAMITSGLRRSTSSSATIRSFASRLSLSSGNIGSPPAISTSSSTHRIPEINGLSHSSKNTRGRLGNARAAVRIRSEPSSRVAASARPFVLAAHDSREHADHLQDVRNGPLVEREHRKAAFDEL